MVWVEVWGIAFEEDKCTERRIAPVGLYLTQSGKLYKPKKLYFQRHPIMKKMYGTVSKAQHFIRTHYRYDLEEIVACES